MNEEKRQFMINRLKEKRDKINSKIERIEKKYLMDKEIKNDNKR